MLDEKNIEALMNGKYSYELKIVCVEEKSPAGRNRHLGSKEAGGDIIIFQDADDLPHLQRNEIIQKIFINNPNIVHILHGMSRKNHNTYFDTNRIPTKICQHNMFNNHKEMAFYSLTNGNIAIRKYIVNQIDWDLKNFRGQDVQLNKNIYDKFKEYLIIRLVI